MMDRRAFFGSLAAMVAGATLDPEKLLWEPGKKLFFDTAPRIGPAMKLIQRALIEVRLAPPLLTKAQIDYAYREMNDLILSWSQKDLFSPNIQNPTSAFKGYSCWRSDCTGPCFLFHPGRPIRSE
jgi:hypothetical protein